MKNIIKSEEPASLKEFKAKKPMDWGTIHKDENKHVYEDCILQCMEDQNNLCGYTEARLNEASLCSRRKQAMAAARKMLHAQMAKEEVTSYLADAGFPTAIAYELSMTDNDDTL